MEYLIIFWEKTRNGNRDCKIIATRGWGLVSYTDIERRWKWREGGGVARRENNKWSVRVGERTVINYYLIKMLLIYKRKANERENESGLMVIPLI